VNDRWKKRLLAIAVLVAIGGLAYLRSPGSLIAYGEILLVIAIVWFYVTEASAR
jgi:hypothetical protein